MFTWRPTLIDAERGVGRAVTKFRDLAAAPEFPNPSDASSSGQGIPNLRPEIHLQEKISRTVWVCSVPGLVQVPGEKVGGYNCGQRYLTESSTDSGDGVSR